MLKNLFTYNSSLGGQRKLRAYVKVALILLIVLGFGFAYSIWTKASVIAVIQATPVPVQVTTSPVIPGTPTAVEVTSTPTEEACPSDPDTWQLLDVRQNDNMKKISPECVYGGLNRAVAWAMMVSLGYTGAEANQQLGFEQSPLSNPGNLNVMTNQKGPLKVAISTRPFDLQYTQWVVDGNGQPAILFSLRGCFRTQTVTGNKVDHWGNGYAVICEIGQDYINAYALMSKTGDYYTTGQAGSVRVFSLFGYDGTRWWWLGEKQKQYVTTNSQTVTKDIQFYSTPYGAPIWDSQWLSQAYGIQLKALPARWLSFTETAFRDNILGKLNSVGGAP